MATQFVCRRWMSACWPILLQKWVMTGAWRPAPTSLSSVEKDLPMIDQLARRGESLAGRTNVSVLLVVECEVFPTEAPILALRLVDHRDVRRYLCLVEQPVEVGSGSVGGVAGEPFRLDVEALLGALDHGLGCSDLNLVRMARDASTSMS